MMRDIDALTTLFRDLGAPDPESWARSQVEEGFNQLHRFLFLRQAWSLVVPDGDDRWIDATIQYAARQPEATSTGTALRALIDAGADRRLIAEVVRGMQAELLFGLCYLLEDPCLDEEAVAGIGWRLVEADEMGEPIGGPIAGLHESVSETDPSRQAGRPGAQGGME